MATFLYRLGRLAFRRRRLFLMFWIIVLAAVGIGAAGVSGKTTDDFSLPGTQSQKAIDLLGKEFPQASAGGATARVVFEAPGGQKLTSTANKAEVTTLVADLRGAPQVASVSEPFSGGLVSRDGTIAYAQVTYKVAKADLTDAASDALNQVAEKGEKAGLTVSLGGNAVEVKAASKVAELIGLAVAAVVLVITFGSMIAAGLPLLTALFGVGMAIMCITIATSLTDMGSSASTLALMLGLAVAIDYALFIVSRYRSEIRDGHEPQEAVGRALGTAGSAVVFAGLTVVIALAGLSVIGIRMLTTMGLAAAFAVAVAVIVALTLLPAVLGFAGMRIMKGKLTTERHRAEERGERETMGVRWGRCVTRNPVKALVASVVGLGLLAIPALSLRLTLPDDSMASPGSTQRIAYDTLSKGFGPGFSGPLTVVVDARDSAGGNGPEAAARNAYDTIVKLPDVAAARPAVFNESGDVALIGVIPRSAPTSEATKDLVADIRDHSAALHKDTGADLMVTGTTALNIDISTKLADAMLPYLAIVVGLALILLLLVFRSILVPLKAALGFLLSVASTLGVLVAVFQWGWLKDLFGIDQTQPLVSLLPILLIGIVFGLAMDYEVFLVSRMREEYVHGAGPTEAIVAGFRHGGRVVTAAAVIMISVFAGFLLDDTALVKSIGLGLAAAVFFDAFVVRMTIVPAVMTLLGRHAWALPQWLDRILPNVDVEGEKLRHALEARQTPTPEGPGGPVDEETDQQPARTR
ncbi:MMPL family transporter [Streptomyces turgidiscabies]|uniref:Putative membrane protein n=1 Tax=Streptomyces turgidiscabies (strain Car8) TaxID=698760 RepID=L7F9A0_STRT8|nr:MULTISPECIES: MMPL family transporter [Streptomyces]ELP68163.1 putative membrane protein [Streptomyces turgidiscabies Car8]MDX3493607.1 MMPL family transporter [Streptomyces turgidiscabies]GAQ71798.1 membrane protein YdfJ [Streptomyces turgidiscabies]